jgi:5-methylcytosine-specific restriction enzyme subunit McrC
LIRSKGLNLNFNQIKEININELHFKNLKFDRNTERYREAVNLAKLIILHYSPDLQGGNENVLAILFDMNKLYENFIYKKLKKLERTIPGLNVREQLKEKFWESKVIKPDIVGMYGNPRPKYTHVLETIVS